MLAGCSGTLGLESGGVADTQLSASSVWEWSVGQQSVWAPSGARLKKAGLPWASAQSDLKQWLQVDLKREKRITGTQPSFSKIRLLAYTPVVSFSLVSSLALGLHVTSYMLVCRLLHHFGLDLNITMNIGWILISLGDKHKVTLQFANQEITTNIPYYNIQHLRQSGHNIDM